uniref:Ankyrin repeat and SOCS box containing 11 n=1 Tax=Myripristis murdjan TaxID=586833 RepID=A0A667YPK1_9TELE
MAHIHGTHTFFHLTLLRNGQAEIFLLYHAVYKMIKLSKPVSLLLYKTVQVCVCLYSWSDRTPLHEAAYQGRLLNVRTLIAQGFHVDMMTVDRVSPLHEACLGGRYACAKFLVDHGANVDTVSTDGATPLFNACSSGSAACVRLILQHSSSVHTTYHLASPIHEAAKKGVCVCVYLQPHFISFHYFSCDSHVGFSTCGLELHIISRAN